MKLTDELKKTIYNNFNHLVEINDIMEIVDTEDDVNKVRFVLQEYYDDYLTKAKIFKILYGPDDILEHNKKVTNIINMSNTLDILYGMFEVNTLDEGIG